MMSRLWVLGLLVAFLGHVPPDACASEVGLIRVKGAISPATGAYITRAVEVAAARNFSLLILQLDTPGGLVTTTKEIIEAFDNSKVPVAVYVAPAGADAGSAGCFITLAADIAAMAPYTRIGAAHPVGLGPTAGNESTNDIMKTKIENDMVSYMENIAKKQGRNVEWAKSAVKESASITSEKALDLDVIDYIAKDIPDLLSQVDGREVKGKRLAVAGATIAQIPMVARERFFQLLWHPEILFILMLAAMYGIIGEVSSPGAILPGVVGAIALILVLYMSAILPVNVAGLALLGLSVALFVIDVFAPTHGVLTFGGVVAFFLGALMLFNRSDPVFRLSLAYIIPGTILTAAFFIFVVGAGLRAQRNPAKVGAEAMLGQVTPAVSPIGPAGGKVFIEGEYWNAYSDRPIDEGARVEIVDVEGLTLKVKPV